MSIEKSSKEGFFKYFCSLISNEIGLHYSVIKEYRIYTNTVDLIYSSIYLYSYRYIKSNYFNLGDIMDAFDISGLQKIIFLRNYSCNVNLFKNLKKDVPSNLDLDTIEAHSFFLAVTMQVLCLIIYNDKDVKNTSHEVVDMVSSNAKEIYNSLVFGLGGNIEYKEIDLVKIHKDVKIALNNTDFMLSTNGFHKKFDYEIPKYIQLLNTIGKTIL